MLSKVQWGAIFAGAFIATASMVFFSLFALAIGISGVNVIQPLVSTISLGGAVYAIATAILSFALGGYCTTRLANLRDPGAACLHALAAFSVAGTFTPFLFSRTYLAGGAGFAVTQPVGVFVSAGLAWTLFLSYGCAAVAACAGGVQACYRGIGQLSEGRAFDEAEEKRRAA
jgi:hypothetical protein